MENVEGISDRREARKFIGNMLRKNYIKHTVNKVTFSENSYYQFGEGDTSGGCLLNEDDGKDFLLKAEFQLPLISLFHDRFGINTNRP